MSMQTLTAWGGSELVDHTTELIDKEIRAFIVREDTVIEKATGEGSPADVDYLDEMNLTGKTLIAGDWHYFREGVFCQHFKLASGSVNIYK